MIELLVACTILAILTTMVAMNVNGSLAKARDSKRKEGLRQIVTGLNLYYNVTNMYPPSAGSTSWPPDFDNPAIQNNIAGCGSISPAPSECSWGGIWEQDGVNFMPKIPQDPQGKPYYYRRSGGGRLSYILGAELERTSDPDISQSHTLCHDEDEGYYLIGQLPNVYFVCDTR